MLHYPAFKLPKLKKTVSVKHLQGYGSSGFSYTARRCWRNHFWKLEEFIKAKLKAYSIIHIIQYSNDLKKCIPSSNAYTAKKYNTVRKTLVVVKFWKQLKLPSTTEWISKVTIFHIMGYYTHKKINEFQINTTLQINPINKMLNKISQTQ